MKNLRFSRTYIFVANSRIRLDTKRHFTFVHNSRMIEHGIEISMGTNIDFMKNQIKDLVKKIGYEEYKNRNWN